MQLHPIREKVLIIDFGSQLTKLIARRIRELGVYSEIITPKNLNTVVLLNPKNEEAIYLLMDIEIDRSNFAKVKKLKEDFEEVCSQLCPKISSINEKLKNFDTKNES